MLAKFVQLAGDLIGLIYPSKCLICDEAQISSRTHLLCDNCLNEIASRPMPNVEAIAETPSGASARILEKVHTGWHYDTTMQQVIHTLKYRRRPSLSKVFGDMLAQRLQNDLKPEMAHAILVPVPLHPRRGRERGFNQSILLAETLAKVWNMLFIPRALERVRFTESQATLDAQARKENVDGAFAPAPRTNLQNHTIFLVDDVFTTGATMHACAMALKSAGATRVIGLALAKAR
jgi:ComF family protein